MVIYEYCFIWIPELRKAHFFKLFCYKWNKYIMNGSYAQTHFPCKLWDAGEKGLTSVSYTHLDVYKRQTVSHAEDFGC